MEEQCLTSKLIFRKIVGANKKEVLSIFQTMCGKLTLIHLNTEMASHCIQCTSFCLHRCIHTSYNYLWWLIKGNERFWLVERRILSFMEPIRVGVWNLVPTVLESIQGTCRLSSKTGKGDEQKPLMYCIRR